jgi:hypothetical protein
MEWVMPFQFCSQHNFKDKLSPSRETGADCSVFIKLLLNINAAVIARNNGSARCLYKICLD